MFRVAFFYLPIMCLVGRGDCTFANIQFKFAWATNSVKLDKVWSGRINGRFKRLLNKSENQNAMHPNNLVKPNKLIKHLKKVWKTSNFGYSVINSHILVSKILLQSFSWYIVFV